MNDEPRPIWHWIVVTLIGLPLLYVASFGPACWICSRTTPTSVLWETTEFLYSPLLQAWWHSYPGALSQVMEGYANLWANGHLTVGQAQGELNLMFLPL